MRRTPDKETIAEFQAQGKSLKEIARLYGVTVSAIRWAISFEQVTVTPPGPVPLHVVRHWRYIWGWSEDKIRQHVEQYTRGQDRRVL